MSIASTRSGPESSHSRIDPRSLIRDPLVAAFACAFAILLIAHSLLGWVVSDRLYALLAYAPFLGLAALAAARAARRGGRTAERRFWWLWVGAFLCWIVTSIARWALPADLVATQPVSLATDLLFVAFYALLALSAELTPHREEERVARAARQARSASAVVFVVGLLVYFVVIPWSAGSASYATWIPSLLLYLALDVYLVIRFLRARQVCTDARWRETYTWCAAAALAWTFSDGWNVLSPFELVPAVSQNVWDLLGFPPLLLVVLGAHRHTRRPATADRLPMEDDSLPPERWSGVVLAYAVVFPALHFLLHAADALDYALQTTREVWIVLVLSQLAFLSWTYQRKVQAQVLRLEGERRVLNRHIELTQRLEAVGRLAGGVAHDFNNSLQLIGTHADLLLREKGPEDPEFAHVSAIRRAVVRAGGLTDELLTLSRKRRVQPVTFDLNEVLNALSPLVRKVVGERIDLEVSKASEPLWIRADKQQLEHAVVNLLLNARDALPDGGEIEIRSERRVAQGESTCTLSVSDTGIGMDEGVRLRIFEPFFTTKGEEGTGLGLSMVYGIVTQCGGSVKVESRPGAGSRFLLAFPAVEAPVADPSTDEAVVELVPARPVESVLVVEDELPILAVIKMHLRASGYDVRTAADGASALELFDERPADVVITDVAMPGMSGLELHAHIEERRPGTPVLFMSGYADSVLDGAADSAHDVPLLRKPFTTDELDSSLRRALDQAPDETRRKQSRSATPE